MAWWGKLIGGTFGFMLGGPLGAMLGAALGHQVDYALGGRAGVRYHLGDQERVQTAFFTATFSVMGHVAKADGRVAVKKAGCTRWCAGPSVPHPRKGRGTQPVPSCHRLKASVGRGSRSRGGLRFGARCGRWDSLNGR